MDSIVGKLLLQVVLIGLNAFFAATEIAVVSLNTTKLKKMEEEGDKRATRLLKMVDAPSSFLSTIQIAITLSGFLGSAFAADSFSGYIVDWVYNGLGLTMILANEMVEKLCEETPGEVSVANYNCPGQLVITGEKEAVDRAAEKMKEAGAKRCVPLKVSGPFHSPLLKGAGERLAETLEEIEIQSIQIPYLSNVTAEYVEDPAAVKELLVRQVSSPVRWQQCVERMIADGVDTFVEIGPGKTLSGFMRKINRSVKVINIQTVEDFEKAVEELQQKM